MPASDADAVLRLCNLSPVTGLEIRLDGQDTAAISGVAPIDAGGALVQPGSFAAELRADGDVVGRIDAITVTPGQGVSVAVWGDPGALGCGVFPDLHE